jgi:hypothetical protein
MTRILAAALLAIAFAADARAQDFAATCRRPSPPVLAVSGQQFTLDGTPAFLVLASYFDAMRAPREHLESDFAYLKSKGVRGVRIFPMWTRDGQDRDKTLIDEAGRIRSAERWDQFATVLRIAGACGMVVDLTFNREMLAVDGVAMSQDAYQSMIAEVVGRLKAGAQRHVFVDLQNERNRGLEGMDFTASEIRALRNAVKRADPDRIVMCSTLGGVSETLSLAAAAKLDVAAFHEGQEAGWHHDTPAIVSALKKGGLPVYLQEMARAPDRGVDCEIKPGEPNPFLTAMRAARAAGAAAWTFHTDAGFRLDSSPFQARLKMCGREREFLEMLSENLVI